MALEKTSGRGVRNSYGPRSTIPQQKNPFATFSSENLYTPAYRQNLFINEYPTYRLAPYDGTDTQLYTAFNATADTATIELDSTVVDPTTGRAMAKVTIPIGSTLTPSIDYFDLTPWQMEPEDVWMLSVYLPDRLNGGLNIQLLVTDKS